MRREYHYKQKWDKMFFILLFIYSFSIYISPIFDLNAQISQYEVFENCIEFIPFTKINKIKHSTQHSNEYVFSNEGDSLFKPDSLQYIILKKIIDHSLIKDIILLYCILLI